MSDTTPMFAEIVQGQQISYQQSNTYMSATFCLETLSIPS